MTCLNPVKDIRLVLALAVALVSVAGMTTVLTGPVQAAEDTVSVVVDRAKVLKVSEPAATVIIGNPAIADATVYDASTLVITGRSFGTTNLIVLNSRGDTVADKILVVAPPQTTTIQVHRRSARYSYSCNPNCAPTLAPGDQNDHYEAMRSQIQKRHQMSKASAAHQ